ncbi:MAG TPA: YceI family protein [Opitutus sp.]|nr:YceI family protein [Opitutus sp.]
MIRIPRLLTLAVLGLLPCTFVSAAPETYVIDPVHSSVGFDIRHFVSKVPGTFTKFNGTIVYDAENPAANSVEATVDIGSVNTASEKRDNHLRSGDFFEAEKFPTATFKSKSWKKTGADTFDVTGDLTIKGVTKEVVLATTLLGVGPGPRGSTLSGWEATTTIKKSDFNLSGPAMLSTALGDEVKLRLAVEAGKK